MRIGEALARLGQAADIAAARGSLIFHLDLATEIASAAFDRRGVSAGDLVALADSDGYRVLAFDGEPGRRVMAEARFDTHGDVEIVSAPAQPGPRVTALGEARATISATRFEGAARHVALVVPAVADPQAAIAGYAIAHGDDPDTAIFAGHWLVTLDPTGRMIVGRDPLETGGGTASLQTRALRDTMLVVPGAVPGEIYSYLSLKHGLPLLVETRASGVRWRIDGERTSLQRRAA